MTLGYIAGELSLILGDLASVATNPAERDEAARLRREAETVSFGGLPSVAARALELTERACWESLARGEIRAFTREAAICTELWEFGICSGLLEEAPGARPL